MKHWLTRRHPRYIRALAYMMQATEYNIRDFLRWHERIDDFRSVEKRKQLKMTAKAMLMLAAGWAGTVLGVTAAIAAYLYVGAPWNYAALAIIMLELPLFALAAISATVVASNLCQNVVERALLRKTRSRLAAHPALKIAIAGSYGKTTMREILKATLAAGKKVAAPPGSFNTPLGVRSFVSSLSGDEEVLIFELGEYYSGDIRELCEIVRPVIGIITGVNEAHLEKFGTLQNTARTIFEIQDYVTSKRLYINGESENLPNELIARDNIIYSGQKVGDWIISDAQTSLGGTHFIATKGSKVVRVQSKLLGLHMVGSLAAAIHIADTLGMSPVDIEKGIATTSAFEHRLFPKSDTSGVVTLDDSYNGNPTGVTAVIAFLASLKEHRRFYVTPGLVEMGHRTEAVHREIGKQLARAGIEYVVLIRNSVTAYIEEGLNESGFSGKLLWFDDGPTAYASLPHMTVSGDVILLQNDWPDQYA